MASEEGSRRSAQLRLRYSLYILALAVHVVNACLTLFWVLKILHNEPVLQFYLPLSPRFFSVWTIAMHIANAVLGIICYRKASYTHKQEKYIVNLRRFKKTFFCSILWPSSWVCSTIFWFFYYYDKSLLKFDMLMKIGYPLNNHIEHTFTVLTAVCELFLQAGTEPKSHTNNVLYGVAVLLIYFLVLWYTFVTRGTWLYPFYDLSYGTVYFPLLVLASCVLTVVSYYAQWPLTRLRQNGLKSMNCIKSLK